MALFFYFLSPGNTDQPVESKSCFFTSVKIKKKSVLSFAVLWNFAPNIFWSLGICHREMSHCFLLFSSVDSYTVRAVVAQPAEFIKDLIIIFKGFQ